jgi:hypothetical protein
MNTPVSFEIAKLLKEKGFDVPTQLGYDEKGGYYCDENWKINYNTKPYSDLVCSAPTISEVVMWLFETHNIWIYLTREPVTNTFGPVINNETKTILFTNQSIVSRVTGQKYDPWYNKPENGYQRAIEYVLTEII